MKRLLTLIFLLTCALACAPAVTPASTAQGLIGQLKAAGLEVERAAPLDGAPAGTVVAIKFYTPSLCDGCSSIVLIFESEAKALEALAQLDLAAQTSDAFKFHIYRKGPVLLRMGGLIEKSQADRYAAALGIN